MKKIYLMLIVIAILIAGGWYWYAKSKSSSSETQYVTGTVEKGTLTVSVSGTGNVEATETASVSPSISGTVANLAVNVGDSVTKGQFLFNIINDDLQITADKTYLTYKQALASIDTAETQILTAQNDLNVAHSKNDVKAGTVSDDEIKILDQKVAAAKLSKETAELNAKVAYNQYLETLDSLEEKTVTAPIDGVITTLSITNGDSIGSSSSSGSSSTGSSSNSSSTTSSSSSSNSGQSVAVIANFKSLKASVAINEVDAANVKKEQKVTMTFDAIEGLTLTGKVEKMDSIGTESSGVVTYNATISFDKIDDRVKPGMSVTAVINIETKQDVLLAPSTAVKTSNNSKYVQILENGQPKQITVTTGSSDDTNIEITSGLTEGEEIITQTISNQKSSSATTSSSSKDSGMAGMGALTGGGPGGR